LIAGPLKVLYIVASDDNRIFIYINIKVKVMIKLKTYQLYIVMIYYIIYIIYIYIYGGVGSGGGSHCSYPIRGPCIANVMILLQQSRYDEQCAMTKKRLAQQTMFSH